MCYGLVKMVNVKKHNLSPIAAPMQVGRIDVAIGAFERH